jgi:hypothetical protein
VIHAEDIEGSCSSHLGNMAANHLGSSWFLSKMVMLSFKPWQKPGRTWPLWALKSCWHAFVDPCRGYWRALRQFFMWNGCKPSWFKLISVKNGDDDFPTVIAKLDWHDPCGL